VTWVIAISVAILVFVFWIVKGLVEIFDTPRRFWIRAHKSRGTLAAAIIVST
jgi:hypothetical protein